METLREGYFVKIPKLKDISLYWQIVGREPFNYRTGDGTDAEFSSTALVAGASSGDKNIENMEPDESPRRLFQVRAGVEDGCSYKLKIPTGSNRFGVDKDKDSGYIDTDISHYLDMNPIYEFWLIHDFYPAVNATNNEADGVIPKLHFEGMKYDIDPIKNPEILASLRTGKIPSRIIAMGGVRQ